MRHGLAVGVIAGACASLVAREAGAVRPDDPGAQRPAFDSTERLETFASPGGSFLIHFSRAGRNAVLALDADRDGTPDYVSETASVYDQVLAFYRDMWGFRAPPSDGSLSGNNGGDARFDVYLVDFAGVADGSFRQDRCNPAADHTCAGYMLQDNDFAEYSYPSTRVATVTLASHEFFHAVQAGYDVRRGPILEESTAVWGTEQFDPSLNDFEGFVGGYLMRPDRSLDQVQVGPVDAFSYGAALWWQFLTEHRDRELVRRVWSACNEDSGSTPWLDLLDATLQHDYASSFAAEYSEFTAWNLYTAARANATRAWANGARYPLVTMNAATLPFSDDQVRLFHASTRYYRAAPMERSAITAAFVPLPDSPADALANLSLRLAVRRGNTVDPPRALASLTAGAETVDASGATEVIALLTNTATSGQSRTPGFCMGTVDEVAACRAMLAGDAAVTDAAVTDASVSDASTDVASDAAPTTDAGAPSSDTGCSCSARSTGDARWMSLALAGLCAMTLRRRARR